MLDLKTMQLTTLVSSPENYFGIALDVERDLLYFSPFFGNGTVIIYCYNLSSKLMTPLTLSGETLHYVTGLCFDKTKNRLFVSQFFPGVVSVIDLSDNTVSTLLTTADVVELPWKTVFDADTETLYIADQICGITSHDLIHRTHSIIHGVPSVGLSLSRKTLYTGFTEYETGRQGITRINLETNTVQQLQTTGEAFTRPIGVLIV
jgi:DNA-binding beta-propeller fold protein YncE